MIAHALRALAIAVAFALTTAPSLAADQAVQASGTSFSPRTVTINVGDTVTWNNASGGHNVKFDDGSFEEPADPSFANWSVKRTFNSAGEFRYFCEAHGGPGGYGMSGTVVVQGANQPPPPPPGGTEDTTAPDIDGLRVAPSRFCNRKTKRCPKPGARITFTIDEDATIAGRIIRRRDGKRVGKLSITAASGTNRLAFSGRNLALGKYRLELFPKDEAGNRATSPTRASFTIATSR